MDEDTITGICCNTDDFCKTLEAYCLPGTGTDRLCPPCSSIPGFSGGANLQRLIFIDSTPLEYVP
jgi:hypothetical protein